MPIMAVNFFLVALAKKILVLLIDVIGLSETYRLTCDNIKCNTATAVERLQAASGIKYSSLIELPYPDPIRFTIVNPMHNLFLGTAKYLMKQFWIEKRIVSLQQLKLIQNELILILLQPAGIRQIPQKITTAFGGFTAEQWKNWVILYSMYSLCGILPQEHYRCWQTFVLACFHLCRRVITDEEIKKLILY